MSTSSGHLRVAKKFSSLVSMLVGRMGVDDRRVRFQQRTTRGTEGARASSARAFLLGRPAGRPGSGFSGALPRPRLDAYCIVWFHWFSILVASSTESGENQVLQQDTSRRKPILNEIGELEDLLRACHLLNRPYPYLMCPPLRTCRRDRRLFISGKSDVSS